MSTYYKPSGNFSPVSFIYFILSALIIFPILALIYTYLIWYIPFIYINFFITAGFGFAVGITISQLAIKIGKVRNTKIALLFGLLGGAIALYFSWAIWVDLVINAGESYGNSRIGITSSNSKISQILGLALQPNLLFELISEINETGTWGLRSSTVSGIFLTIIWVIELLIVLVISIFTPYIRAKIPFCELDNKWFNEEILPAYNYIKNSKEMTANLENSNQQSFDELEDATNPENESHSIFTLFSSEKGESYLTIENKLAETNSKGEIDFKNNEFIEYIAINRTLKDKLLKK